MSAPVPSPSFRPAGIVLAAGASRRMGTPKALLPTPSGLPLAAHQAARLRAAGCAPAAVVIGSAADAVRAALPPTIPAIENPRWAEGRATSLQAAAAACPDAAGWLFLPVDAIGIRLETLQTLLATARWNPGVPWRPLHRGQKGNLLWIPRLLAPALAALPPDARIDDWVAPLASSLDLDDPALLRNANTPADYAALPPDAFAAP
ncbi:MAG: NTP transferase domain-containing protein [Kiritimatiellae bacterium]|nr:NTP transferase domain-containing protein [Kiritimatiellia bacterium]